MNLTKRLLSFKLAAVFVTMLFVLGSLGCDDVDDSHGKEITPSEFFGDVMTILEELPEEIPGFSIRGGFSRSQGVYTDVAIIEVGFDGRITGEQVDGDFRRFPVEGREDLPGIYQVSKFMEEVVEKLQSVYGYSIHNTGRSLEAGEKVSQYLFRVVYIAEETAGHIHYVAFVDEESGFVWMTFIVQEYSRSEV